MELKEINNFIKTKFVHEIYKYNVTIFKLTAYKEGILTFTQLTPSPLNSIIMEIAIWDKILGEFTWMVPYKEPLGDPDADF